MSEVEHFHNLHIRCPETWINEYSDVVDVITTGTVDSFG
jgi:hypothetical protein